MAAVLASRMGARYCTRSVSPFSRRSRWNRRVFTIDLPPTTASRRKGERRLVTASYPRIRREPRPAGATGEVQRLHAPPPDGHLRLGLDECKALASGHEKAQIAVTFVMQVGWSILNGSRMRAVSRQMRQRMPAGMALDRVGDECVRAAEAAAQKRKPPERGLKRCDGQLPFGAVAASRSVLGTLVAG